ncbi:MAG: hypothetical protein EU547_00985 [Promethearchaeota archaeon]|nr:MAG: hypothetical protein EU547_00985 [Candidatus Lokiarchaeota archaeon]
MSVRESLIKHLTAILRESESTLLVVLCDLNGLSIAKIGRKSEVDVNPNQITSLASAAFSVSQENWDDLNIKDQVVSFTFFEKVCLITIRINQTLLTIVHNYVSEWPLDPDSLASSIYYLKQELNKFFGSEAETEEELESFSNKVRNALYLIEMGTEIENLSYTPDDYDPLNPLPAISEILDSMQNEIFIRYGLAGPSGLMLDARDISGENLPISIEAFSANSTVAFQKMKEESQQGSIGDLLCYIAISGNNPEQLYGLITCPSGKLSFSKINKQSNIQEAYFIGLFSLDYGGIPIIGEIRNIIYSILEIIGNDEITDKFIRAAEILTKSKFD